MNELMFHIAEEIENKFGRGNPASWKNEGEIIKTFLQDVDDKLQILLKEDYNKAKRCGVPFIKGRYYYGQWNPIDATTFRRIFIYQTTKNPKPMTKNQLAIYLGYESIEDFILKKNIILGQETKNDQGSTKKDAKGNDVTKETKRVIYTNNYIEKVEHSTLNFHTNPIHKLISKNKDLALIELKGENYYVENNKGKLNLHSKREIPRILTTLPKLHVEQIIGRSAEIFRLHDLLSQKGKIVSIHSSTGIGKTALVKRYLQEYRNIYKYITWIDSKENIYQSFADNYQLIDSLLINREGKNERFVFQEIMNCLGKLRGNNLLIIDNVGEDIEHSEIYDSLQFNNNWKVLVTTEEDDLEDFLNFELKPLSLDILKQLFKENYQKPISDNYLNQIIELLNFNTGDILFVAKRTRELRLKIEDALQRIQKNKLTDFDFNEN